MSGRSYRSGLTPSRRKTIKQCLSRCQGDLTTFKWAVRAIRESDHHRGKYDTIDSAPYKLHRRGGGWAFDHWIEKGQELKRSKAGKRKR